MKKNNERVLFTDDICNYNLEDYEEYFEEIEERTGEKLTEEEKWEYIYKYIEMDAEYAKINLDIPLSGDIIAIADLGLWDGRHTGYKELGNKLSDIFQTAEDMNTYYCDRYNLRSRNAHHDGTNYILYRMFRPGLGYYEKERFTDLLYYGKCTDRELRRYTVSLRPEIEKIYGI